METNTHGKPALITGATGYIGSQLLARLIQEGKNIHVVVRACSDISRIGDLTDKVTLHTHDGTTESMINIFEKAKPDTIIHLATMFIGELHPEQLKNLLESNITFGTQLLEAASRIGPLNFINTGTFSQHYQNSTYSPVNLYAATKQAFEAILQYYTESIPLKTVTLEIGDTYGPADPRPKVMPLLLDFLRAGGKLDMSPGEQVLDLLHVDDVAEAFMIAATKVGSLQAGKIYRYALSSGEPIRLKDLVAIFEEAAGTSLNINWGGRPYRRRETMRSWEDGTPLPDWEPRIPLLEGIRNILARERT